MPTIYIGLYLAIWTGVGLLGDHTPSAGLYILAQFFIYVYNLVAYIGLIIVFAKRCSWVRSVADAAAEPTIYQRPSQPAIYQQPVVPASLYAQQHVATPMPGSGVSQA
jgi:hypothetical protein